MVKVKYLRGAFLVTGFSMSLEPSLGTMLLSFALSLLQIHCTGSPLTDTLHKCPTTRTDIKYHQKKMPVFVPSITNNLTGAAYYSNSFHELS